ncbi:MAG: 50S ribosomal protein L10 [Propionibacteriaceae bacterium]|jgi:large subunit ribosomal protein L10|nr:50S ribosomal protein L10 [Propionibacteriaceae bacterium]
MARPDKEATVKELSDKFSSASATVLTEYRGLTVKALKTLRRSLGDDATYAVAKNTLTKIAAHQAGVEGLDDQLNGPTAIAFITGDVASVAKGIKNFARENPALVIKGGYMDGKVLDADTVKKLADLESREVLLAKLAGAMNASLSKAVYLFAAPLNQAARAMGALHDAAQTNPTLIGGAGASAPTAQADTEASVSTPAADAADETPAEAAAE